MMNNKVNDNSDVMRSSNKVDHRFHLILHTLFSGTMNFTSSSKLQVLDQMSETKFDSFYHPKNYKLENIERWIINQLRITATPQQISEPVQIQGKNTTPIVYLYGLATMTNDNELIHNNGTTISRKETKPYAFVECQVKTTVEKEARLSSSV